MANKDEHTAVPIEEKRSNGEVSVSGALGIIGSIGFFFVSTISLTFFNKWFLVKSTTAFKFPFAMGAYHQCFTFIYVLIFEKLFLEKMMGPIARKREYVKILAPVGFLAAIDWGSANFSLQSVPLSLYEIIKSTCPMWTLVLSIVVALQPAAPLLITSILAICIGTYLAVTGQEGIASIFVKDFPLVGATVLLVGSIASGVKAVTVQFVMQRVVDPVTKKNDVNALTMTYYLAPTTALTMVCFSLYQERSGLAEWAHHADSHQWLWLFVQLTLSAGIAFCVTIAAFILTRKTSGLTYSVVKIAQRVLIVFISVLTMGDHVAFANGCGFALSLIGIALYNYYEIIHKRKKTHFTDEEHEELVAGQGEKGSYGTLRS